MCVGTVMPKAERRSMFQDNLEPETPSFDPEDFGKGAWYFGTPLSF
jgi:hypothetical protein